MSAGAPVILGTTEWVKRKTLRAWNAGVGTTYTEIWSGPYNGIDTCFDALMLRTPKPTTITPNCSGYVAELQAVFATAPTGISGTPQDGDALSENWERTPVEHPLKISTHPAFKTYIKSIAAVNTKIADGTVVLNDEGDLYDFSAHGHPAIINKYRDLLLQGTEYYVRDRYDVTCLKTYSGQFYASQAASVADATTGTIVAWASFGADSGLTEPVFASITVTSEGTSNGPAVPYQYFVRGARVCKTGGVWTMQRTWNGLLNPSATLYPGGNGIP